jgi:hypothetical protein
MRHEDANRSPDSDMHPRYTRLERRAAPRIETPFPVIVRSAAVDGQLFEEYTMLDNLSSSGLYLRLARRVQQSSRVFALIRLSAAPDADASVACIALHGLVMRTESLPGGVYGTAIRLTHHRFINAKFGFGLPQMTRIGPVRRKSDHGHTLREAGD